MWQETGQIFNSPSAWATHCKKLVNPAKKSGCGWASVKYKGQKLDKYKATWLRLHQLHTPATAADEVCAAASSRKPPRSLWNEGCQPDTAVSGGGIIVIYTNTERALTM